MKAALIGLGRMGLRHLQVLRDLQVDVAGVADAQEQARANAMDASVAEDRVFSDSASMLATVRPDLAVIATTAPSHCDLVCRAAAAGARMILCEKPMAVSLGECERMLTACNAAGAKLAINHQMRFMEQYTYPKQVTMDPSFGGLSSVTVLAGNFGIAMNGSHYFEMFRYMTGEVPTMVSARFSAASVPNPRGPQYEDRAGTVRLETNCGKRFYMDASTDQGHGMFASYVGPYGRLDIDELAGHARLTVRKAEHRSQPTTRYGMPWDTTERTIASADAVAPTRAVLEALLADNDYPDGEVGHKVVQILVASHLSDEQGGATIDLADVELPRDRVFPWA